MPSQAKINFYPFSDGAALHKVGSHRLWVLNRSSAVLWCLYAEQGEGEGLVQAYAVHFNLPATQAQADIEAALQGFTDNGLLDPVAHGAWRVARKPDLRSQITDHESPITDHGLPITISSAVWQKSYQIAGICWQISCDDTAFAESRFHCLEHLSVEGAEVDLHYAVVHQANGWTVTNAMETVAGLADDEVLPSLLTMLFCELSARLPQYLLLHAAVAVRDDQLLLLPGESAFGKSTLSAALAASGWTLFSDELAPLDPVTLEVASFSLPVGIKIRSLPVLQPYYPNLAGQTGCRRADGQIVRYLSPPQIHLAGPVAKPTPVSALVFPRFVPDGETRMEKLTPLQALELLANTGSSERALTSADVEALLTLAGQRPCWSLHYSNLQEAVEAINTAMRNAGRGPREE